MTIKIGSSVDRTRYCKCSKSRKCSRDAVVNDDNDNEDDEDEDEDEDEDVTDECELSSSSIKSESSCALLTASPAPTALAPAAALAVRSDDGAISRAGEVGDENEAFMATERSERRYA